jgi:hypothetical protein
MADEKNYHEEEFEKYLINSGIVQNQPYVRLKKDGTTENQTKTLPTKIRNIIHHPENTHNTRYTDVELKTSIESLIPLLT